MHSAVTKSKSYFFINNEYRPLLVAAWVAVAAAVDGVVAVAGDPRSPSPSCSSASVKSSAWVWPAPAAAVVAAAGNADLPLLEPACQGDALELLE